ncbi:MAG TPA: GH3 auxin-responsive promoter family protein, partial [Steroidobacteraceae bacterium]|nr:GH3 auxin-responsive promoter family protein [Steroidobacteraceae bacterium]
AAMLNAAWVGAQSRAWLSFRRALRQPQAVQERRLSHYLRANAGSDFGRRYRFADIRSCAQFQERVPLSSYESYAEAVSRMRAGACNVLTSARVRCLQPSSGSTRAAKLIPYTADLQSEFSRAVGPWVFDLARTTPRLLGGPAYWSITPAAAAQEAGTSGGAGGGPGGGAGAETPLGFESDSAYLGGWLRRLADGTLVACEDLKHAADIVEFRHRTLLRLMRAPELRLISVWHPSFLTLLLDVLAASWSELLADLARGVPAAGRLRREPPRPRRARELAQADPRRPRSIWPRLALVSCWGDAQAATLLAELHARLPGVAIQPKGLMATEAVVSLPFAGQHPLAIRSHFFEFIDKAGNARTAWQLEQDESYSVVVTTGGGLYRYQLRDRIRVTGFLHATPCIRFTGKEDSISDLRGEKLSEGLAASILSRLLPAHVPGARFALLAPETEAATPGYVLFVESEAAPSAQLPAALESALAANPNYAYCVRLGQLRPAAVERVAAGAAERYLERLRASGQRLGNIKPVALSPLAGWRAVFAA